MPVDIGDPRGFDPTPYLNEQARQQSIQQAAQNRADALNQQSAADTSRGSAGGYSADMQNAAIARQAALQAQDQAHQNAVLQQTTDFHNAEIARQNAALANEQQQQGIQNARNAGNDVINHADAEARIKATNDNNSRMGSQFDIQQADNEVQKAINPLAQIHAKMVADGAPPEIIAKSEQEIKDAAENAKSQFQGSRLSQKASDSPAFQENFANSMETEKFPIEGVSEPSPKPQSDADYANAKIAQRKTTAAQDYATWKNQQTEEEYADKAKEKNRQQTRLEKEQVVQEKAADARMAEIKERDEERAARVKDHDRAYRTLAMQLDAAPDDQTRQNILRATEAQATGKLPADARTLPILKDDLAAYDVRAKALNEANKNVVGYKNTTGEEMWHADNKPSDKHRDALEKALLEYKAPPPPSRTNADASVIGDLPATGQTEPAAGAAPAPVEKPATAQRRAKYIAAGYSEGQTELALRKEGLIP